MPGNLVNFGTVSMDTGSANNLHHVVGWQSDTGDLADLAHITTREHIWWDSAPAEFGPDGDYAGSGEHFGLGTNNAVGGTTVDDHSVLPPTFRPDLPEGYEVSNVWMMYQQYEYSDDGGTSWQPIPGATYEITRWFEKQGTMLVAYCAKRGTGADSSMHRAMVALPNYFT
jgi:hypothetical protein